MILDAHQHFWKISRDDYSWMDDSVAAIRQDFLPADFAPIAAPLGVTGTIVVQAAPTLAETKFLLKLADVNASIVGVVGWVDLEADNAVTVMQQLSTHPRFKGIRPMLQDITDTEWVLQPHIIAKLEAAAALGLRMDALVTPRHLDALARIAKQIPTLPIVIDHCAKPAISGGRDAGDTWRSGMQRLSAFPNVFCKLSGLANEYGDGWSAQALQPVFEHVLSCFGPERLMWGSDWPVLNLAGNYSRWVSEVQILAGKLTEMERDMLFSGTACKFYDLEKNN